jgi:phosphatidate cytidylyltransferase
VNLEPIHIIFLIAISTLSFATLLTWILRQKQPQNLTLTKVSVIVKSWWLIMAFFLGGMAVGRAGVLVLFTVANIYGLIEYLRHSRLEINNVLRPLLILVVLLQSAIILYGSELLFLSLPGLLIPILIPLIVIFSRSVGNLPFVFATTIGLVLMSYFLGHVPALVYFHREIWQTPGQEILAVAFLFLLTEANDVFQFLSGKFLGRRKIVPEISPNKTEAGFIGGLILTPILACITLQPLLNMQIWQCVVVGAAVSFVGILGDLMFSTIKRYLEIKDFSELLPGHGGLLDRLDSLVLTAPIYFHLILYFKGLS